MIVACLSVRFLQGEKCHFRCQDQADLVSEIVRPIASFLIASTRDQRCVMLRQSCGQNRHRGSAAVELALSASPCDVRNADNEVLFEFLDEAQAEDPAVSTLMTPHNVIRYLIYTHMYYTHIYIIHMYYMYFCIYTYALCMQCTECSVLTYHTGEDNIS